MIFFSGLYLWQRAGVLFPQRSPDAAPIFTPPVVQSTLRHTQAGYGMPINSSTRLDEAMAAEMESLRFGSTLVACHVTFNMLFPACDSFPLPSLSVCQA